MVRMLSPCAQAMLVAIVDRGELAPDELRMALPPMPDAGDWPADLCEWFDELQAILDAEFVIRVLGPGAFHYRATRAGIDYANAWVHPIVHYRGSVA